MGFLQQHGRTSMSALGGKIKKPASIAKLGAWMKERPDKFKIVGDSVELAK